MAEIRSVLAIALAIVMLAVVVGGLRQRIKAGSGIGWQFIRYTVIAMGIPAIGILALTGSLTGEASTLIAAAMAYAFGKSGDKDT